MLRAYFLPLQIVRHIYFYLRSTPEPPLCRLWGTTTWALLRHQGSLHSMVKVFYGCGTLISIASARLGDR